MPSRYPAEVRKQVVDLARSGTRVAQLAETFGMSEATIYNWLKQERIDRGETPGLSTEGQMELAAARRRIRQLETELARLAQGERGLPRSGSRPKSLYPVIESLTGQGFDVNRACVMLS